MALDKKPETAPNVSDASELRSADVESSVSRVDESSVSHAESSLDRAERLVEDALSRDVDLGEASRNLTLAQWSLRRQDAFGRQWPRQATMTIATAATLGYLTYRLFWTLNLATGPAVVFSVVLFAAELHAAIMLMLYFFQVWRLTEPPLRSPTPGRTVDVFVATYNEDVSLLRGTLMACIDMEYPHETHVLDDGARDEVRELAEDLGVRYISRTDRTHAKAGNLNNALRRTEGELVVVLDADHVPCRHYLSRLVGYFDDPRVGLVQTPHTTYNLDNFLGRWKTSAKLYWEDVRIFFEAVQLGKNRHGVACFCGSAAVIRRKALEDAGLFATETITEDLHTGMRINAAGWKSIAVSEEMVAGLAPDDAATFAGQRLRWGEGNLSVMAHDNPLTMKGLTWAGRINYFASIANWTLGPTRLILYLTPLVMLLTGIAPVADMSPFYFAVVGFYLVTVLTAVKVASNRCGQLLGIELAVMASFHLQIRALWRAVFRRGRQTFVVTSKRPAARKPFAFRLWPQAALVAISVVSVAWAASRIAFAISEDYLGLAIGSALAAYHSWLALTVLGRASRRRIGNHRWRHPACLAVDYSAKGEAMKQGVSLEFNEDGCRLLAWEPIGEDSLLDIAFHTPVGSVSCRGRVRQVSALGKGVPFGYVGRIAFDDDGRPTEIRSDRDRLRSIAMEYIVPVVTMAHRLNRPGRWPSPEMLSGGALPIPLSIDAQLPNVPVQKSVALLPNRRGFFATLEYACPIEALVEITLHAPGGDIRTVARVRDVETIRVGSDIVHQHQFEWTEPSEVRSVLVGIRRWSGIMDGATAPPRDNRRIWAVMAASQTAACLLVAATVWLFAWTHRTDVSLAAAMGGPLDAAERDELTALLAKSSDLAETSTPRLTRIYNAANAVGKHALAADAARLLADRIESRRAEWTLTWARQLVLADEHAAADAVFDEMLSSGLVRGFSEEERAEVYIEAARAAVAVDKLDKAVARFLEAKTLRTAADAEVEELLGVLISARRDRLALQLLEQMERSDRVLRAIVDVHEMAGRPEAALPALEELLRSHPEDAYVVRRLAELAVLRGDYTAAMGYYETLREVEPDSEAVRTSLAEVMLLQARDDVAQGRFDRAMMGFDAAFRVHPPDEALLREYGGVLIVAGRLDEAVQVLEPLESVESRILLATALEMRHENREALQVLLDVERAYPLGRRSEHAVVRLLLAEREYDEAVERLLVSTRNHPNDAWLRSRLVEAVAASNRRDDLVRRAMTELFAEYRAAGFEGMDAAEFARLGDALRRLGLFDAARVAFDAAVAEFAEDRLLRFRLAQTFGNLERYEDAETQYEILLDSRPPVR